MIIKIRKINPMNNYLFDYKRFILLNRKRVLWVVLTTLVCAALSGATYYIKDAFFSGPGVYRTASFYYITFDSQEFEAVHDYYNDYTWNDVLDSDVIAERAAELSGVDKQEIIDSTTIPTMSDIRMIWVYSDNVDKEKSIAIEKAIAVALSEFAEKTKGFESIEVWDGPDTAMMTNRNFLIRITVAGGLAGLLVSILVMLYCNATDSKIYAYSDIQNVTDIKGLGIVSQDGVFLLEAKKRISNLLEGLKEEEIAFVYADSFLGLSNKDFSSLYIDRLESKKKITLIKHENDDFYKELDKYSSYIMLVEYGKIESTALKAALDSADGLGKRPAGILLVNMDRGFASLYYGREM